jgi:hypothetical protein
MIVRVAALAAAVLVLAAAPAARAKGIGRVKVCGPDRCAQVPRAAGHALRLDFETAAAAPRRRARFYRVTMEIQGERGRVVETLPFVWVPSAGLLRSRFAGRGPRWSPLGRSTTRILRATSRGLRAYPAARMPVDR